MNKWEILWNHREMILGGFKSTLVLFGVSAIAAFALSSLIVLAMRSGRGPFGRVVRGVVDGMRMLPFLIYAYLLYYGLPSLGIRFDAWTAGFIALITYHAAYFAEILRGTWATLSAGQAEAARAVQSQYFIPFEAFIVAIGLYWLTSMLIEALVARIGFAAEEKGLGYKRAAVRR